MRLVYKIYSDGKHSVYQTEDDGSHPVRLAGVADPQPPKVKRMTAYIEVSCDDAPAVRKDVVRALQDLPGHIQKNRG